MHGNTPYAGRPVEDITPAQRQALRREMAVVTARARSLLPDEFLIGAEIRQGSDGPEATVAVQPPSGSVVSAGFTPEENDPAALARDLAAGAALEARRAYDDDKPIAR